MNKIKCFEKFSNEYDKILSLKELKEKYPEITFIMNKKDRGYFVRADIKTQDNEYIYLGSLKGQVNYDEGLKFLNNIANNNYDKYY